MKKSTLALAFAVVLAVLAVVAVRRYLEGQKEKIDQATKTVKILLADDTIPAGEKLRRQQTREFDIPISCLLAEMVEATRINDVLGKKPKRDILRGRMLLLDDFTEDAPRTRVPIPPGRRIASVGVNSVTGISGLISPGDYVDVLWMNRGGRKEGGGGSEAALTLFPMVQVFAVDDITTVGYLAESRARGGRGATAYTTVTLVLHPLECEILTFANAQGEITLVKRSPGDGTAPASPGVDQSHLDSLLEQARRNRLEGGNK